MLVTNPPSAMWGRNHETGEHELVIYSAYVTDTESGSLEQPQTIRLTVEQSVRLVEFITRFGPAEPSPVVTAKTDCERASEDAYTCASCNSPIGAGNGCDDEFPDLCDDCWFATTSKTS